MIPKANSSFGGASRKGRWTRTPQTEDREKKLDEAISKLLEKFPPREAEEVQRLPADLERTQVLRFA